MEASNDNLNGPKPPSLRGAIEQAGGGPAPVPRFGPGPELPPASSARERPTDRLGLDRIAAEVIAEVRRAQGLFAPCNSHHEAYALLKEEVEEYWIEVKKKRAGRDPAAMRRELTQVAAVAILILADLGTEEGCRR